MDDIVKALDPIFKPKSIAVIGASNDPTKWGYRMVYNPIYSGYARAPETYRKLIEIVANIDYIDGIIIQLPPWHWWTARMRMHSHLTSPTAIAAFIREIIDAAEKIAVIPDKYGKPTIVTILHPEEADPLINIFQSAGLPLYETPEDCARAMRGLAKYAEIRRKLDVGN